MGFPPLHARLLAMYPLPPEWANPNAPTEAEILADLDYISTVRQQRKTGGMIHIVSDADWIALLRYKGVLKDYLYGRPTWSIPGGAFRYILDKLDVAFWQITKHD